MLYERREILLVTAIINQRFLSCINIRDTMIITTIDTFRSVAFDLTLADIC